MLRCKLKRIVWERCARIFVKARKTMVDWRVFHHKFVGGWGPHSSWYIFCSSRDGTSSSIHLLLTFNTYVGSHDNKKYFSSVWNVLRSQSSEFRMTLQSGTYNMIVGLLFLGDMALSLWAHFHNVDLAIPTIARHSQLVKAYHFTIVEVYYWQWSKLECCKTTKFY